MSIATKEPKLKAPWPPSPANDPLYRYPKPRPVGQERGESFSSIARRVKVDAADLLRYNFGTTDSAEINWYLANYVKCPEPRPGQKYYEFFGAPQDLRKNTGVIFVPTYGETVPNALNRFGERLVDDYNNSAVKEPHGLCYAACYARVQRAGAALGVAVPGWKDNSVFSALWGSLIAQPAWKDVPDDYKGLGAAGAMVWAGLGTHVDEQAIWRGELEPGAVIQVWRTKAGYKDVKLGKPALGHSFIFLNYIYSGSTITGMAIADQGYQSGDPLPKGEWGVWIGANLFRKPARDPNTVRYGPNP